MLKKLMIAPYFGGLPPWYELYLNNVNPLRKWGWDFMTWTDEAEFARLCRTHLFLNYVPSLAKKRKVTDFFPMLGEIFCDYLQGYDYWGHGGLDQVYGRLHHFLSDCVLEQWDIWSNELGRICGPFAVYRNSARVNSFYKNDSNWRNILESDHYYAYDEAGFSQLVKQRNEDGGIAVEYQQFQGADPGDYDGITLKNGLLRQKGKEIMMFHFNRKQRWPISAT